MLKASNLLIVLSGGSPFRFHTAEVGLVDASTVAVTFSRPVSAAGNDYSTGVTIQVAGVGAVIAAGVRQANTRIVHYTLGAAVTFGQAVTWAYSAATGHITDSTSHALPTTSARTVTNNVAEVVGGQLDFSTATNSGLIAVI